MTAKDININNKKDLNSIANHPLQSFEWGEFRKKTGIKVIRKAIYNKEEVIAAFQLTIHKIPKTPWSIGYLPKGSLPTQEVLIELEKIGKEERCIFIQLEPNVEIESDNSVSNETEGLKIGSQLKSSAHPLFTRYTFQLDLTKDEEELLKNMHPKTRYNIKIAQKHGVKVIKDNSDKAFAEYLKLTEETTKRQKFYAHTKKYHQLMWETLRSTLDKPVKNELSAHLLLAKYQPDDKKNETTLTAWIVFVFKDTLYYPYGASSSEYRHIMASNLMMWEAIRFGKNLGLKKFDMWGSLGPNPNKNDPWYGFHRFKEGYGAKLIQFLGSYDFIINKRFYNLYKIINNLRWFLLKARKNI